jgi:hypothetical protein
MIKNHFRFFPMPHVSCYRSMAYSSATMIEMAAQQIQALLLENEEAAQPFINYDRVHVGGVTLAAWLQKMAHQLNYNGHTVFLTAENVLASQIDHTFTIDIKPSLDLKYTYTANVVNSLCRNSPQALSIVGCFKSFSTPPSHSSDVGSSATSPAGAAVHRSRAPGHACARRALAGSQQRPRRRAPDVQGRVAASESHSALLPRHHFGTALAALKSDPGPREE